MVAREGLGTLDYELLANPQHIQAVSGLVTAVIYQDVITIKQYALHTVACHFDNRERFRVGTQVDTNPIFPKGHCKSWLFVFTRTSRTDAVLVGGYLLINQTGNKAETLLGRLREALGGLHAWTTTAHRSPSELMTEWLHNGEADGMFELDDYVVLVGAGDMAPEVRIKRKDVTAEEVVQHVKCGKRVAELGLVWRESIAFVLTDKLTMKKHPLFGRTDRGGSRWRHSRRTSLCLASYHGQHADHHAGRAGRIIGRLAGVKTWQ